MEFSFFFKCIHGRHLPDVLKYPLIELNIVFTYTVIQDMLLSRFQITRDKDREAIPYPEVIMSAKDGIYLHFKEL